MALMKIRRSVQRIVALTVLFGLPLLVLIAGMMLPHFLKLETYRPLIEEQLREASGRHVTVGALRARLVPPGVTAEKVGVFEREPPQRPIVTAERVRLRLRLLPLLSGKISLHTAAFERPVLILYTDRTPSAPALKAQGAGPSHRPSLRALIHQGTIELRGSLFGQTVRWPVDNVEGEMETTKRRITLTARPSFLGRSARLVVTLDPEAEESFYAELKNANLDSLFAVLGSTQAAPWTGSTLDAHATAQWPDKKGMVLYLDRLRLSPLPEASARGSVQISTTSVSGKVQFDGLASTMTLQGRWRSRRSGWEATANVSEYSPEVLRLLMDNYWVKALEGPGSLMLTVAKKGSKAPQYSLKGSSFTFTGSRLLVPSWWASDDGAGLQVGVEAKTPEGDGKVEVRWAQASSSPYGNISIAMSTVTVGDVFDVFSVRPSTPLGLEPWLVREGHYTGLVHDDGRVEIENTLFELQELRVATAGEIDLSTSPALARFEGQLSRVNLSPVLESLGVRPSPLSGLASADYSIQFSADSRWLQSLSGRISTQSQDGFLRAGKLIYKIAGVLNLTNLVKSSNQSKTTKDGIPYRSAAASATLTDGLLDCEDLKIRTPNYNIGGKGKVNLPESTIDAKIKLQFLNVLKDSLNAIPLVKRVITPDTGLLEVPVRLRGKLDNPEID